jgi:hypothetical protein
MTPTDTVVSEATDTKHVKAMIEAVGHAGRVGVYHATDASGDLTIHGPKAKALLTELLDRRTATPQSGGVVVKGLEWREITSPREDGPAEPTGDVEANTMIGEYSVCFDSDEDVADSPWCAWAPDECIGHFADPAEARAAAQTDFEARILSTLAGPIPEAPADEEVEGALDAYDAETRKLPLGHENRSRGASTYNWRRSVVDEIRALIALRRSTETDKPGVRGALTLGLEAAAKWHDAEAERIRVLALDSDEPRRMHDAQDDHISHAAAIRALSASPLTEEQPAAKFKRGDRVQKIKGSAWRGHVVGTYSTSLTPEGYNVESENEPGSVQLYPAAALETLPRSTTGGAK